MQLSARNQLLVQITEVKEGAVNSEIIAKLGNQTLRGIITLDSQKRLKLAKNEKVYFIFKASSVILAKNFKSDMLISAANRLNGKVCEVKIGAVNSEVILDIDNGGKISAIITNESVENLKIKVGDEITALVKASNIIIGK